MPDRLALDGLEVATTDRLLVTGGNGTGKSTLLAVLAGHLATEGTVRRRPGLLTQAPDRCKKEEGLMRVGVVGGGIAGLSCDPVAALRQYDDLRRPVLNALVLANRALGPEEIIARAAEHGGPLPADRAAAVSGRYKELSLATVADVNDRPSWTVPRPDVR